MKNKSVLQFKVTLQDIEPAIWRRIQIPEKYSFWDLHVAIQDAMGWYDSHLHQFIVNEPKTNEDQLLGIPDEDGFDDEKTLPDWDYFVKDYVEKNNEIIYLYDFGDGWYHSIEFEGQFNAGEKTKYPICLDGERACPPEDVGGIPGYYDFLEIMKNPKHKEHKSMVTWFGKKYDSEKFDSKKVKFDNPKIRWKHAIGRN